MKRVRLAIVGAGAAGLMAAYAAARRLPPGSVALLEGNPKPGKKLLATGNGRCNLTNIHMGPAHYHGDVEAAGGLLAGDSVGRVLGAFSRLGVLTRTDEEGRVYPYSLQASAVLQALWQGCEEQGVSLLCGFETTAAQPHKGGFLLSSKAGGRLWAGGCVLACGGMASPRHSCGEKGYGLAQGLGHTITGLRPSLTPLSCPRKDTAPLKGMRCKARAALWAAGREVWAESGEVLFGDGTVSGICIFQLSARLGGRQGEVVLDLAQDFTAQGLTAYFTSLQRERPALLARELFSGVLNLRVGQHLAKQLGFVGERPLGSLSSGELRRAAGMAKGWRLPVGPCTSWEGAQVTAGGVPLAEVDCRTMGSKKQPGLYLAGEMLDLDGDCGGYNLHWAWLTGLAAGAAAAGASIT